jgi:hypothetical protein
MTKTLYDVHSAFVTPPTPNLQQTMQENTKSLIITLYSNPCKNHPSGSALEKHLASSEQAWGPEQEQQWEGKTSR